MNRVRMVVSHQALVLALIGGLGWGGAASAEDSSRQRLLDSDPDVIYMDQVTDRVLQLEVGQPATVFGDKEGNRRLGTLKAGQKVPILAITDRAYRVRGQGMTDRLAGWVSPQAFVTQDPEFVSKLKAFYHRQLKVNQLIAAKQIAIGMSLDEVAKSRGAPTKTVVRETPGGKSGRWEYIEYEEVKHYANQVDPVTGMVFRQLVSVTREEKGKTVVEFENSAVSAIEETEDHKVANMKIVLQPFYYFW